MSDPTKTLLPSGLYDLLPPEAALAARCTQTMLDVFAGYGYERVCPPLAEFEESLFSGRGRALAGDTFRLMDPETRKMCGIRADMTMQIARIAASRLANAPRPLRLCYAGEVLRVRSGNLRGERQLLQAGVELIGTRSAQADAEVIILALEALEAIGVQGLSVDLNLPWLVAGFVDSLGLPEEERNAFAKALSRKDSRCIDQVRDPKAKETLRALLTVAGPAAEAIRKIENIKITNVKQDNLKVLDEVIGLVRRAKPNVSVTMDAVENRGLDYHTGISFSLFAAGFPQELGRGGRYQREDDEDNNCTGFTIYINNIIKDIKVKDENNRIYVSTETDFSEIHRLRSDGYTVVRGLEPVQEAKREAERLKCGFVYAGGKVVTCKG